MYTGPERRVRFVYETRHTRYHVVEGVCVNVESGPGRPKSTAEQILGMRLDGYVRPHEEAPRSGPPQIGARLYFGDGRRWIVTSPIIEIKRATPADIAKYPPPPGQATRRRSHPSS